MPKLPSEPRLYVQQLTNRSNTLQAQIGELIDAGYSLHSPEVVRVAEALDIVVDEMMGLTNVHFKRVTPLRTKKGGKR